MNTIVIFTIEFEICIMRHKQRIKQMKKDKKNWEKVSASEYQSYKITSHFTYGSEDAIAFLFDADIHLWKLVSFNINRDWHGSKQWIIKLIR